MSVENPNPAGWDPEEVSLRNEVFSVFLSGGMEAQQAFDFSMCIMHRRKGIELPWGELSPALLNTAMEAVSLLRRMRGEDE